MTDDEFALAIRAAAKQHGIKIGVIAADGRLTQEAIAAHEHVTGRNGEKPGDGYTNLQQGNYYTMDLNGNWVFGFNIESLQRKMRTNSFAKLVDMFPAGWRPGEPLDA